MEEVKANSKPESILLTAARTVGQSDRGLDYGHPLDNFIAEAALMNTYLKHVRNRPAQNELHWKDMAVHKIFMKIVRNSHRHKTDNQVDIAGYAWCLEEAQNEFERRLVENNDSSSEKFLKR